MIETDDKVPSINSHQPLSKSVTSHRPCLCAQRNCADEILRKRTKRSDGRQICSCYPPTGRLIVLLVSGPNNTPYSPVRLDKNATLLFYEALKPKQFLTKVYDERVAFQQVF